MEHKQTIVLRKDLNMRKGKMIAQGAHASMRAILMLGHQDARNFVIPLDERLEPWLLGLFKEICVSVNSEAELLALHEESKAAGLIAALIQDAGLTEAFRRPTRPLAVGPDWADCAGGRGEFLEVLWSSVSASGPGLEPKPDHPPPLG